MSARKTGFSLLLVLIMGLWQTRRDDVARNGEAASTQMSFNDMSGWAGGQIRGT